MAKHLADQHNPVAYVKSLDFAPEYVSCEYHTAYSNPGFIAKLQAMGVKVALWTVDTEDAVRSLLPLGPDCLVTNRPDRVREWGGRKISDTEIGKASPLGEVFFAALDKQGQWNYNSLISNSFIENSLSKKQFRRNRSYV